MTRHWITQGVAFLRDEEGQSLAEYGLVAAILAIGAIGILSAIGTDFNTFLTGVAQRIVDTINSVL